MRHLPKSTLVAAEEIAIPVIDISMLESLGEERLPKTMMDEIGKVIVDIDDALALIHELDKFKRKLLSQHPIPLGIGVHGDGFDLSVSHAEVLLEYRSQLPWFLLDVVVLLEELDQLRNGRNYAKFIS